MNLRSVIVRLLLFFVAALILFVGALILPLSASAQTGSWTYCATEGGVCAFTGTKRCATARTGLVCLQNVVQRFRLRQQRVRRSRGWPNKILRDRRAVTTTTTTTRDWTFCARKAGSAHLRAPKRCATARTARTPTGRCPNGTACTNSVFGDPAVGATKSCATRALVTTTTSDWTFCAWEYGVCAFAGTKEVRYGANGCTPTGRCPTVPPAPTACSAIPPLARSKSCATRDASPRPHQ